MPARTIAAVLVVLLLALLLAGCGAREATAAQPVALLSAHEGGIYYSAFFDPTQQRVNALISYDYLAADGSGVREYIAFNRRASASLIESGDPALRFNVLFSRPLSQAEFERVVTRYGLTVHAYTMRAIESNGTRVTIRGAPENGQLVLAESLGRVHEALAERGGTQFNGWIDMEVTTDAATLAQMQSDPDIFLTESAWALIYRALTTTALRETHADAATLRALEAGEGREVQISTAPLYWSLEDLGLVPMPTYEPRETGRLDPLSALPQPPRDRRGAPRSP